MTGFRLPGPLCKFLGAAQIDMGTMCRGTSPKPVPLGTVGGKATVPKAPASSTTAAAKNDASTDIEALVKKFAKDMTAEAETLRQARLDKQKQETPAGAADKKPPAVPVVTFSMSQNKKSKVRTPAEQAQEVVSGKSWVCWGAHMADKARHVLMKVDGVASWKANEAFGDDFAAFKVKWGEVMKKHGLKNYKGGDGWAPGDEFHLELPDSKMSHTDERAGACLDEYARLTREEGKSKNLTFEKDYKEILKQYIEKYESESESEPGL